MRRGPVHGDRGTILLVVVFVATAIAGLAAISAARVVTAHRTQRVQEDGARALNDAYGQIHVALNVVNHSGYDDDNHNLELRKAMDSPVPDAADQARWLRDPDGVVHGEIPGTDVRVYRGRDYLMRIQKLKGEPIVDVDPLGASDSYFVLEALGRSGDRFQLVSALVRETEPFSSYVFFQNKHTLGVSGSPRGLLHGNTDIAFYFPNGKYMDSVSSVGGFDFRAGATEANTTLRNANGAASPIELSTVDFEKLHSQSNHYQGLPGLDAEIKFFADGKVRITPYTQPYYDKVIEDFTWNKLTGYEEVTVVELQDVQVGTTTEERTRRVVIDWTTETYTVAVPVYEEHTVEKTRQVPIYDTRTVTKTRLVRVFVPYETEGGAGGGTIGDNGEGVLGEYVWVEESYEVTETYVARYETETYTAIERVQIGTTPEERTRQAPTYGDETYTVEVPVYEQREVEVTKQVPIYKEMTSHSERLVYMPPVALGDQHVWVKDEPGMIYVDGRITKIEGDLNGRLTIVGNEQIRITGDIRYVDDDGDTVMLNGKDTSETYQRNPDYEGNSVLGIIARDDIEFTWNMPDNAEVNATLMSVEGRVGADGLHVDEAGNVHLDSDKLRKKEMNDEEYTIEDAYDKSGTYQTKPFIKDSLRRLGGIISNERIVETYIKARGDGTAGVGAGFRQGSMRYDFNLMHNPPPNFVELPRPVVTAFVPMLFVRDD